MRFLSGKPFPAAFTLCLLLLVAGTTKSPAASIRWVVPPNDSLVTASPITIKGFASSPIPASARATVKQPGKLQPVDEAPLEVTGGQLFSVTVKLSPGKNSVIYDDGVLTLYYHADPSTKPPEKETQFFREVHIHKAASDGCTQCHWVYDRELTLNAELPGLCVKCHTKFADDILVSRSAGHHAKRLTRYCIACHDPHASVSATLIKERGNACTTCHDKFRDRSGHEKVGAQPCVTCHDPHRETNGRMLKKPREELCKSCHGSVMTPGAGGGVLHNPVANRTCDTCHDPHKTAFPAQLKQAPAALCSGCHNNIGYPAHKEALGDCLSCHRGHSSENPKLLKNGSAPFCLGCHKAYFNKGNGHVVGKETECLQCHNPHKRTEASKASLLCGRCHQLGAEAFNFIHGHLSFDTVRQCLVCHEMHAPEGDVRYPGIMYGPSHYPIKNGGCEVCHKNENGAIKLRYEGSENCIRCHGQTVGTSIASEPEKIHAPIRQDDCIACHSPHFKNHPFMLIDEPDKVCGFCHGMMTRLGNVRHKALDDASGCRRCHVPHISDKRPLLKIGQPELCLECHPGKMPKPDDALTHGAMKSGLCSSCHNPHTSDDKQLIKNERGEVCAGCHPEVTRDKTGKPFARLHGPVGANHCTSCHYMGHSHKDAGDKFIEAKPAWKVCQECHELTDEHIPNVYSFRLARNTGGCLGCHFPHGSDNGFMLRE